MRSRSALLAASVALGGCSLMALDGFSGGPDAALGDAADGTKDGAPSSDDAGPGPDDAGDAARGPDGDGSAASPPCAALVPAPTFCSDFEEPTFPPPGWTLGATGGGTIARVTSAFVSPSHGVQVDVPPTAGVAGGTLTRTLPSLPTDLVVSFAARYDARDLSRSFELMRLTRGASTGVDLEFSRNGLVIEEKKPDGSYTETPVGAIVQGAWSRITLAFHFTGTTSTQVTVTIGGGHARHGALAQPGVRYGPDDPGGRRHRLADVERLDRALRRPRRRRALITPRRWAERCREWGENFR